MVVDTSDGIFFSIDAGENWTQINNGFYAPSPRVFSVLRAGDNLFAGTLCQSIWSRSDLLLSTKDLSVKQDNRNVLDQNTSKPMPPVYTNQL